MLEVIIEAKEDGSGGWNRTNLDLRLNSANDTSNDTRICREWPLLTLYHANIFRSSMVSRAPLFPESHLYLFLALGIL
jgi:hypothetical protein